MLSRDQLAARIDHTLLRPDATPSEIDTLCRDACDNGIYAVCVPPRYVSRARDTLAGLDAGPRICTVIGFPSGAHHPAVKAFEAAQAVHILAVTHTSRHPDWWKRRIQGDFRHS